MVVGFVNSLGRDVVFDLENCYFKELFIEVNEYYDSSWYVIIVDFKNIYFRFFWFFIFVFVVFIFLILFIV